MGGSMIITPVDENGISVVSVDILMESLRRRFPDAKLTFNDRSLDKPRTELYSIWVAPASDSFFTVTLLKSGHGFSVDGTNDQNEVVAVAIREVWDTACRIVAVDSGGSWFVDLVPSMTPVDVRNGWRPLEELQV